MLYPLSYEGGYCKNGTGQPWTGPQGQAVSLAGPVGAAALAPDRPVAARGAQHSPVGPSGAQAAMVAGWWWRATASELIMRA